MSSVQKCSSAPQCAEKTDEAACTASRELSVTDHIYVEHPRSNEYDFYRYEQAIQNLPTENVAYFGVGPEQNYHLLSMGEFEHAWLNDCDLNVYIHHAYLYRHAFETSATPTAFTDFFAKEEAQGSKRLLSQKFPEQPNLPAYFDKMNSQIYRTMYRTISSVAEHDRVLFLQSTERYLKVRRMVQEGRVHYSLDDQFTTDHYQKVGQKAQDLGLTTTAIYASNSYDPPYLQDITPVVAKRLTHLPSGEGSVFMSSSSDIFTDMGVEQGDAKLQYKLLGKDSRWGWRTWEHTSMQLNPFIKALQSHSELKLPRDSRHKYMSF